MKNARQHDRLLFTPTLSDRDPDGYGTGVDMFEEDTFFKNGMVVNYSGEGKMIRARPGIDREATVDATGTEGRGCFYWSNTDKVYFVVDNKLYKDTTAIDGLLGTSTGLVHWEPWLGNGELLLFHDGTYLYSVDDTDVLTMINAPAWVATTTYATGAFVTNDTDKVYIATSGGESAGSGGPTGTGTGITDNGVTWDYVNTVTGGSNVPTPMVPGILALDQYLFLGKSNGVIGSCDVGDVFTWTAGDTVVAETLPDKLVQIARHVNYLAAFGETGLEFFYNASNPNGSPLSRLKGTFVYLGCMDGATATNIDDTLVWVSRNQSGTLQVAMLKGFEYKHVSTPTISEILNAEKPVRAMWEGFYYNLFGQRLYVLNIATTSTSTAGECLVYDIEEDLWYTWEFSQTNDVATTSWPFRGAAESPTDDTEGAIYMVERIPLNSSADQICQRRILEDQVQDDIMVSDVGDTDSITCSIQSGTWDGDVPNNKFIHRVDVVGDFGTGYKIKWQDEDQQSGGDPVYSALRTFGGDTANGQYGMTRLGMCRRRKWFVQLLEGGGRTRFRGLDIWYTVGESGGV